MIETGHLRVRDGLLDLRIQWYASRTRRLTGFKYETPIEARSAIGRTVRGIEAVFELFVFVHVMQQ